MKIPEDKLPLKSNDIFTCKDLSQYVVEVSNKFPEAIDIIKELQGELYLIHSQYGDKQHARDMCAGLESSEQFLKSLENE